MCPLWIAYVNPSPEYAMFAPMLRRAGRRAAGVQEARVLGFPGHTETAENLKEAQPRNVITCQVGNGKGEVCWLHRRRREMGWWHWGTQLGRVLA